jgi:hypothetical protein
MPPALTRSRTRELLLAEAPAGRGPELGRFAQLLFDTLHFEYRDQQERLKELHAQATEPGGSDPQAAERLSLELQRLLAQGHYRRIEARELERALQVEAVFRVRLHVRFEDFAELALFARGSRRNQEIGSDWFGLRRRPIEVEYYERVALFAHVGAAQLRADPHARAVQLKLFENIPAADIEMLLPNTAVGMRPIDHAVILVPALLGGVGAVVKLGASLALLWFLLLFWLGLRDQPPSRIDRAAMMACGVGIFAFGSHVLRQIGRFRQRKAEFMQALSENLYFKNLDNDAGVFHRLADEAEEAECKEALLVYALLERSERGLSEIELQKAVAEWCQNHGAAGDPLDSSEGLRLLSEWGLVFLDGGRYRALALPRALARLENRWSARARRA